MESASIQMAKNYRRADMNRAIESVFAEYQKELLEEFHIFALDASYESGQYSEEKIKSRLAYYGAESIENSITRIQLLTDRGGAGFQEQAAAYIEEKYGLASLEGLLGKVPTWKEQEEKASDYQEEEEASGAHLEEMLAESEESLPGENNPLPNITNLKSAPLVNIVMPKDRAVSEKQVEASSLLSQRELRRGYGTFSDVAGETSISKLGMGEYLLEHFSTAVSEGGGALDYEMEYILAGKTSDKENLESVVKRLLLMRFVPNYGYLQSDATRKAEAETLALALSTLLTVPAIAEAVAQALLFAWAFGECIMDVRSLLQGNRVPLVKTGESWQLQLSELLTLGTDEDTKAGKDTEGGLKYKDYIRMLLFLEDSSQVAMRGMDMIEKRLQTVNGCEWFLSDACVSRMEVKSRCSFRRGVTYEFLTYYGYR